MNRVVCKKYFMVIFLLLMLFPIKTYAVERYEGKYLTVYSDKPITENDSCSKFANETNLANKYGMNFSWKKDHFLLKINGKDMKDDVKNNANVKFTVTKIAGYVNDTSSFQTEITDPKTIATKIISDNKVLTKSNSLSLSRLAERGYMVVIKPEGFEDSELVKACGKKSYFEIIFYGEVGAKTIELQEDISSVPKKELAEFKATELINCNNSNERNASEFNKQFCDTRDKARVDQSTVSGGSTTQKFQCDKKYYDVTDGSGYYKAENTKYLMKSEVKTLEKKLVYKYHYSCLDRGKKVKTVNAGACKIKCEEAVKVEYGPPVASKAGLCFEYKVRVTSRVNCGVVAEPPKPESGKLCTPLPACSRSGGAVHRQGGPSENFDNCVKSCDGGVYSDRCTNKCYKKVYGSTNVKRTYGYGFNFNDNYDVEKVANDEHIGEYYCKGSGSKKQIYWGSKENGSYRLLSGEHDSRWHRTEEWGSQHATIGEATPYRCVSDTGIPRRCDCGETCIWEAGSCTDLNKAYMNPGVATSDYNDNVDRYNEYIKDCKAAATCKETEAEFTISTVVGNNTYKFPYSTEADKLKYKGTKTDTQNGTTILNKAGCYADSLYSIDDHDRNVVGISYQTEWSYPGTWIHNKTGEISYVRRDANTGWQKIDKKFCIQLDAPDVNQKWWSYYYTQYNKGKNVSVNGDNYKNTCSGQCAFEQVNSIPNDIKWNIIANTKKFGHFGWDITMECFYALNSKQTGTCSKKECTTKQGDDQSLRVRSVELSNLFPATDGSDGSRAPGFNWSENATNMTKNSSYMSNPSVYASEVQKKGSAIFDSDEELDYHIKLTKSKISEVKAKIKSQEDKTAIKDQNGNVKKAGRDLYVYSDGEAKNAKGIVYYKSKLIRETLNSVSEYPEESALACNNLKGRNACDDVVVTTGGGN